MVEELTAKDTAVNEDAPLSSETLADLSSNWKRLYRLAVHIRLDGGDNLVSRFFREFKRNTPTVIAVEKCESTYEQNRPSRRSKISIGRDSCIEIGKDEEEPCFQKSK